MNKIIIGSNEYILNDSQIESGSITSENALIEETLAIDELDVTLLEATYGGNLRDCNRVVLRDCNQQVLRVPGDTDIEGIENIDFGTPIYYYKDNVLAGKFYKESIIRQSKMRYHIAAISGIGLLDRLIFYGDVYEAVEARDIIASIMNGTLQSQTATTETYTGIVDYVLEKSVGDQTMNGWLAIQSRREAMQQVLFSLGASIFKQPTGVIEIKFSQPTDVKVLDPSNIYIGGNRVYESPVTAVNVTEHSFLPTDLDQEVELFNTDESVENKLIVFSKPCYDLEWNGVALTSNCGANHAYVTGTGTLTGKEYKDSTRIVREEIQGATGTINEVNVTDATMVSSANSLNLAKRVANYYGNKKLIKHDFVWDQVKPGEVVSVPDPFDETSMLTAYVQKLNLVFSNTVKAQSQLVTNWSPQYIGNMYNHYALLTTNGASFTPPTEAVGTTARLIVYGGFTGGSGGGGSTNSTGGAFAPVPAHSSASLPDGTHGTPGAAGLAGEGVMKLDIEITLQNQAYTVSAIGAGGQGGAGGAVGQPGTAGQIGGETIFAGYSSEDGEYTTASFVNPLTRAVYGGKGIDGCPGGAIGESITYRGQTWTAGEKGEDYAWNLSGVQDEQGRPVSANVTCYGSHGSGACYGHNGTNGKRIPVGTYAWYGADGVSAAQPTNAEAAEFGRCGNGGHGSGAPSAGAGVGGYNGFYEAAAVRQGLAAQGSAGSNGSNGSDGFVLILYK